MVKIDKILFPSELREYSLKILPYVLSMSEKYNSTIYLLHVIDDISKWGGFYLPHISLDLYQKEAMEAAEKFMDKICDDQMKGCPNFERKICSGDPATEILKTIDAEAIDLVVMGTHGYKGLERAIFGSVARKVVKNSPIPVLTINPYKLK
ncbi:MAG: universal stress protein [Desulfobacteraceae bacterium]|jgi:nucleotide-binding universal stress UspA family protein|nr:universal stress protein [Desulfobacteraceae bacterium]